jgi:hypothetical protein
VSIEPALEEPRIAVVVEPLPAIRERLEGWLRTWGYDVRPEGAEGPVDLCVVCADAPIEGWRDHAAPFLLGERSRIVIATALFDERLSAADSKAQAVVRRPFGAVDLRDALDAIDGQAQPVEAAALEDLSEVVDLEEGDVEDLHFVDAVTDIVESTEVSGEAVAAPIDDGEPDGAHPRASGPRAAVEDSAELGDPRIITAEVPIVSAVHGDDSGVLAATWDVEALSELIADQCVAWASQEDRAERVKSIQELLGSVLRPAGPAGEVS